MFLEFVKEYMSHTVGKQISCADDVGRNLIEKGYAKEIADPTGNIVDKAVAAAADKLTSSLDGILNATLKQFADEQRKSRKNAVPAIFGRDGDGDPKKSFGDFCLGIARQDRSYLEKHYGAHFVEYSAKAALGEASGVTGGYIVPPEFYNQLATLIVEMAIIRSRAFVQPMASATLMYPYLDVTTAQSGGVTAFLGGVQMYWTEEAQTRTETEPQFKQMELKAHELSGYAVSSNVLLQDAAFGLERFLMTLFSKSIAWYEDYAFLQGNGVGKPLGILNCKAALSVTRNTASSIKFADITKMWSKLLPSSQNKAVWVTHPYAMDSLLQLADAGGRVIWIPNASGGLQDTPPGTILGRPVLTTEKLPSLGTKGDLILVDPSLYVIGDRMAIELAASEHVNFLKNQMTWRVVERVDGQPWLDNVITLQDATSTVSPFVVLN